MKKKFLFCSIITACLCAACGDDSTTGPSTNSSGTIQISSSSAKNIPASSVTESSDSKEFSSSSQAISTNSSGSSTNYNSETGLLTDERDGQVYKTAKIGNQIWMAENFRYTHSAIIPECESRWSDFSMPEADLKKYGQYYSWITVTQFPCKYSNDWIAASETDSIYHGHLQGICPNGWHVPSVTEWQTLLDQGPVKKLLSTEWDYVNYKGTDDYGFSLTIAYDKYETVPCFYTITEYAKDEIYIICFNKSAQNPVELKNINKADFTHTHLRCLMD